MSEKVTTGGTKYFHYEKSNDPQLSKEEKQEIQLAYEKARERKQNERKLRRRNMLIAISIIILLIIITFFLLSK